MNRRDSFHGVRRPLYQAVFHRLNAAGPVCGGSALGHNGIVFYEQGYRPHLAVQSHNSTAYCDANGESSEMLLPLTVTTGSASAVPARRCSTTVTGSSEVTAVVDHSISMT